MNEVKQSDIELVVNSLKDFFDRFFLTKEFNIKEFIDLMEPKFTQAGYRENTSSEGGY